MPSKSKKRAGAAAVAPQAHMQVAKRVCAPVAPSALMLERKSASIVQKAWRQSFRWNQTQQIVRTYLKTGPTSNYVKSIRYVCTIHAHLLKSNTAYLTAHSSAASSLW
jgi:hypothetical protein